MKHTIILLLLLAGFFISVHTIGQGFIIRGKIQGVDTGKIYLSEFSGAGKRDSAKIKNGTFTFKGNVLHPTPYLLSMTRTFVNLPHLLLFMDNNTVNIEIDKEEIASSKVTGSRSTKEYRTYLNMVKELDAEVKLLYANSEAIKEDKAKQEQRANIRNIIEAKRKDSITAFVKRHPSSGVAPYLIDRYFMYGDDLPRAEALYGTLDPAIRANTYAVKIRTKLDIEKKLAPGQIAPDFSQADTLGKMVALKDFRGKYVLLDFWASWCVPCRIENPNLVKDFHEFKDNNFTILSVSFERPGAKEAWINAIHKDGLAWNHVSDLKFWDNEAGKLYGINAVPTNFLIDPSGKIVAKNLMGEKLQQKLKEVL